MSPKQPLPHTGYAYARYTTAASAIVYKFLGLYKIIFF